MLNDKNLKFIILFVFVGLFSCSSDSDTPITPEIDTDGDGIFDTKEISNGTDKNNPCDSVPTTSYTAFNSKNAIWSAADCDGDGVTNGVEISNGTNPYVDDLDTDGDGISIQTKL